MAEAVYWVSTVTTVGLVMAVPAGVGVWLDRLWGTSPATETDNKTPVTAVFNGQRSR